MFRSRREVGDFGALNDICATRELGFATHPHHRISHALRQLSASSWAPNQPLPDRTPKVERALLRSNRKLIEAKPIQP
jgi:hypothetical protein